MFLHTTAAVQVVDCNVQNAKTSVSAQAAK